MPSVLGINKREIKTSRCRITNKKVAEGTSTLVFEWTTRRLSTSKFKVVTEITMIDGTHTKLGNSHPNRYASEPSKDERLLQE
jgi:hypothetical protein